MAIKMTLILMMCSLKSKKNFYVKVLNSVGLYDKFNIYIIEIKSDNSQNIHIVDANSEHLEITPVISTIQKSDKG